MSNQYIRLPLTIPFFAHAKATPENYTKTFYGVLRVWLASAKLSQRKNLISKNLNSSCNIKISPISSVIRLDRGCFVENVRFKKEMEKKSNMLCSCCAIGFLRVSDEQRIGHWHCDSLAIKLMIYYVLNTVQECRTSKYEVKKHVKRNE